MSFLVRDGALPKRAGRSRCRFFRCACRSILIFFARLLRESNAGGSEGQKDRHGRVPLDRRPVGPGHPPRILRRAAGRLPLVYQRTRVAGRGLSTAANVEHHLRPGAHRSDAFARRARRADPAQHRAVVSQTRTRASAASSKTFAPPSMIIFVKPESSRSLIRWWCAKSYSKNSLGWWRACSKPSMKLKNFAASPTPMPSARHFRPRC